MASKSWGGARWMVGCMAVALVGGSGCGEQRVGPAEGEQPAVSGSTTSEIIGGFDASAKRFDAVGTIGTMDFGQYSFLCTATLIGPRTVLTAKQCAVFDSGPLQGKKYVNLFPMYFAVGPDVTAPAQLVEAIAADLAPVAEGGLVELGSDVAVYHLIEDVQGVTPIGFARAPVTVADLGERYVTIGFGAQDVYETLGLRRMGSSALRALTGRSYELAYGSFDAYIDELIALFGRDVVEQYMDVLREAYETTNLLEGYEAYLGGKSGEAQVCIGDGGAPMLARGPAGLEIYGVVSGVFRGVELPCAHGGFYATFGEKTLPMLVSSYDYEDPCEGLPPEGICTGTVASRCTVKGEGDRARLELDCADVGQECQILEGATATCVDPADPSRTTFGPPKELALPTAEELRAGVARSLVRPALP